jgi:outer membrane protein assembly factor BamB/actin-like ATPase involved in cell morphogenesis
MKTIRPTAGGSVKYGLGVDLGTTHTAAALRVNGHVEVARLGSRRHEIPSLVFVRADGEILIGEAAERRGATEPGRLAREFKRRVGDPVPILVGGSPFSAHALMARLLEEVLATVSKHQEAVPVAVTVTHPANWGPYKRELLEQSVRMAELEDVVLRTEPEAAAVQYAAGERVQPGEIVAVYDLGGGTFDAAVLRKTADGFELLGQPEGIEQLGGIDFDEAVFGHVIATLGNAAGRLDPDDEEVTAALARLRRDCVEAKEALSYDTEVMIPVALPGLHTRVRLNRSEFEAMIGPALAETVAAMRRALRSAGVTPSQLRSVLLAGGSSRIPLVAQLLTAELDRPVVLDPHPEHSIALGAARVTGPATAVPEPVPVPAPVPVPDAGDAAGPTAPPEHAAAPPEDAVAPAAEPAKDALPAPQRPSGRASWLKRRWYLGAAAMLALAAVVVAAVLAWPRSPDGGGDADRASSGGARQPSQLWSFDTGRPISGRPALVGGTLYFGSQNGTVYALDRNDGRIIWKYATGRNVMSSPQVLDGVVYTANMEGFVFALGADRGDLRWRAKAGVGIIASPTIANGILYISSNDKALYAFDLTGRQLWRFPTGGAMWPTPAVADGLVYVGSQDGHLYAVDAITGRQRWSTAIGGVYSSPTVVDGAVFVGSTNNRLYSLEARTGVVRWSFSTNGLVSSSPVVAGGTVYVGSFDGSIYAVDARTGGERWRFGVDESKIVYSSPAVADGVVYVGSHAARVYALDAATGAKRWDFLTNGIVGASPRVADGVVYIGSDDGRMYALKLPA